MHIKKGHVISMHAKCRCTSMMSSRPYRCCGDAEDALFTQSRACNHRLYNHAACIIHNAHNRKQITHLHVHAITDINAHICKHKNHKCTLYKHVICIIHNAHKPHAFTHICMQNHKYLCTLKQTYYMHYSQTHESQTCMNMQSDTSAHCTNTVCAL